MILPIPITSRRPLVYLGWVDRRMEKQTDHCRSRRNDLPKWTRNSVVLELGRCGEMRSEEGWCTLERAGNQESAAASWCTKDVGGTRLRGSIVRGYSWRGGRADTPRRPIGEKHSPTDWENVTHHHRHQVAIYLWHLKIGSLSRGIRVQSDSSKPLLPSREQ